MYIYIYITLLFEFHKRFWTFFEQLFLSTRGVSGCNEWNLIERSVNTSNSVHSVRFSCNYKMFRVNHSNTICGRAASGPFPPLPFSPFFFLFPFFFDRISEWAPSLFSVSKKRSRRIRQYAQREYLALISRSGARSCSSDSILCWFSFCRQYRCKWVGVVERVKVQFSPISTFTLTRITGEYASAFFFYSLLFWFFFFFSFSFFPPSPSRIDLFVQKFGFSLFDRVLFSFFFFFLLAIYSMNMKLHEQLSHF